MKSYIAHVKLAWLGQDGDGLAELLSLRHSHTSIPMIVNYGDYAANQIPRDHLPPPLDDLVTHHVRAVARMNANDAFGMYEHQSAAVQALTKILQMQKEKNWMLPVMNVMCQELRLTAIHAERAKPQKSVKPGEYLEKCTDCLMGCFRVCACDNRSSEYDTKRWGMLALVNQLLKIYFKINKLHLCKPLIRAIESSPYKSQFALAQQITYNFFVGRMFDSDYKAADEYLTYAFEHCHKQSTKNKRLILTYLVPVKMLLGYMPKKSLLQKYDLMAFWELTEAVKKGDLRKLERVMEKREHFFISARIYLIVEKLKIIAYRNLFKKVYLVLNTHQIPLDSLLCALQMHGVRDVDMDEVECLVTNLIFEGKIRGYISHQHKKLVISKRTPFPKLSTVP